jgi:aryl-phospho-beta-D-glucosidase BglC (GH1 family)
MGTSTAQSNGLSWLHTQGANIVNAQNVVFVPKGAAVMELAYQRSLYQPAGQILSEMKSLGANTVRLAVNSAFWSTDPNYRQLIDQIVAVGQSTGIYVMIDLHNTLLAPQNYNEAQVLADMKNPSGMITFWTDVAGRYKGNSAVLYSLLGQPLHSSGYFTTANTKLWWDLALKEARAMHQVNPKALLFIPTIDANQITSYYISNPWPEPNIVYALHRYYHYDICSDCPSYATAYAKGSLSTAPKLMEQFYVQIGFQMLKKGYPVFLVEFGATTQDPNWDRQITDLYSLLGKYSVGYTQWVWYAPTTESPFALHLPDHSLSPQGQLWIKNLP